MMNKIKDYLLLIAGLIITGLLISFNIIFQRDRSREIEILKDGVKKRKEKIKESKSKLKEKKEEIEQSRQEINEDLESINQKIKEKDEEITKAREEYDNAQKINASDARRILNDFLDRTNNNGQ